MSPEPASDFDLGAAWELNPRVALRPESFGALAYHFGTRRLSFLKDTRLLAIVESLADAPSAAHACRAAGVGEPDLPRYRRALATLADTDMIVPVARRAL